MKKGTNVLKDALVYLNSLVPPLIVSDSQSKPGTVLASRQLFEHDIREPLPQGFEVRSLQALVDLITAGAEGIGIGGESGTLILVEDPETVILTWRCADEYGRQAELIRVDLPATVGLEFGKFYDHEAFLIAVAAHFTSAGDRDYLLRIAANLTNEHVINAEDSGISQTVGLRSGAVLKAQEPLRNRVSLAPYRTFREVEQPASEFLFRVRQEKDEVPRLALFEADGGAWRLQAVANIQAWLKAHITNIPVIA